MSDFACHVPPEAAGQRLDRFLGERIADISREKIKKAIQDGQCRVRGVVVTSPSAKVLAGQDISLALPASESVLRPEEGDITPLWQDESLLVLNKAAGLTVHPCPSCPQGTLVQRLAAHFPQLLAQEGLRPGIVHRLDKDTSGLLAVALTEAARLRLSADFAERRVGKEYLALVRLPALSRALPPATGECREPLGRHPTNKTRMAVVPENKGGRTAHSEWRTLYADPGGGFALLAVTIHSGRTHQIRVHLAHCGLPLWGDKVYGEKSRQGSPYPADPAPRQMLHAWKLTLPHPVTGEDMRFTCPPPEDMLHTMLALRRKTRRVVITGLPGCGKSSLLHLWEKEGAPVWSADAEVARLYAPGGPGHDFLQSRFGQRFVPRLHAPVDRQALRQAMQEDPLLRQEVECAVHALVRQSLENFWQQAASTHAPLAVAEVPLYLELGWRETAVPQETWLVGVACPEETRHARLHQRRGWSAAQCRQMDGWQWPEERKLAACRWRVDNSGSEEALARLAAQVWQKLHAEQQEEERQWAAELDRLWQG